MSETLDFKQNLKISKDNVTVTVPVSIKYRRISNEEWAKIEAERIEAARAKTEEEAIEAAVAKATAGKKPSPAERERILAAAKAKLGEQLTKAYNSANEAKVIGLWVSYDTPLPKGLIIAANRYNFPETQYFSATVDSSR